MYDKKPTLVKYIYTTGFVGAISFFSPGIFSLRGWHVAGCWFVGMVCAVAMYAFIFEDIKRW